MIYASTGCLGTPDLAEALAAYCDAGIDAIELGNCRLPPGADLHALLARHEGTFLVHNYFPPPDEPFVLNLASADSEIASRSRRHVGHALELCAAIGSPLYSVHAGFVTDPVARDGRLVFPVADPAEAERADGRFRAAIAEVLPEADRLGVRLLVENNVCAPHNVGNLLLQTTDEIEGFFAAFRGSSVGLLLDLGHLLVSAQTLGFDAGDFVDRLAPHVGCLHVHENDGSADRHLPVAAGSWAASVVARLADVPLVAEARLPDAAAVAAQIAALQALTGRK